MLTRRHIRVKVMQSVYALQQSQNQNLDTEIKFLQKSIGQMQQLYLLLMALFKEIHSEASKQIDIAQKKYLATAEEKNPNRKFINNKILCLINEDEALEQAIEEAAMNRWNIDSEYVKIIYRRIIESQLYTEYMKAEKNNLEKDKDFIIALFKHVIAQDEKLYEYIEDFNLTWTDDLPIVNTYILKLLKKVEVPLRNNFFLVQMYKNEDDKLFATDLLKKVTLNDQKWQQYINEKTPNWDKDRIAVIDGIILKMAICEFLRFPSIPIKVTLNEYLEIAKEYSTDKSSIFINGILDTLAKEFREKNELNKTGRGLM